MVNVTQWMMNMSNSGMMEAENDDNQHWVRRSVRAAGASQVDSPHVVKLLAQIRYICALKLRVHKV